MSEVEARAAGSKSRVVCEGMERGRIVTLPMSIEWVDEGQEKKMQARLATRKKFHLSLSQWFSLRAWLINIYIHAIALIGREDACSTDVEEGASKEAIPSRHMRENE